MVPLGIDQSRADCASLGPLHMLSHDREPVRIDRFYVVVEEKKPRTVGLCDRIIFRCGIIHSVCEIQHTMRKICGRLSDFVALAHLNDHDFVIRIARPADHAFDTSLERLRAVETRNDNGDFFGFAQLASHIKRVGAPVDGNMGRARLGVSGELQLRATKLRAVLAFDEHRWRWNSRCAANGRARVGYDEFGWFAR